MTQAEDAGTDGRGRHAADDATHDGMPFAAEALRLVAGLQEWAQRTLPAPGTTADGHLAAECQWCPLCQFVAVLRGERPEVTERVAEAGVAVASAVRALLDATAANSPTPADDEPAQPHVQRIDLTGEE